MNTYLMFPIVAGGLCKESESQSRRHGVVAAPEAARIAGSAAEFSGLPTIRRYDCGFRCPTSANQ